MKEVILYITSLILWLVISSLLIFSAGCLLTLAFDFPQINLFQSFAIAYICGVLKSIFKVYIKTKKE